MALDINQLKADRMKIWEEMRKHQDQVIARSGDETAEEKENFEKMETDIRKIEKLIEREEVLQQRQADLAARAADSGRGSDQLGRFGGDDFRGTSVGKRRERVSPAEFEKRVSYAFQGWLRASRAECELEQEHLDAAKWLGINLRAKEIDLPVIKDYRNFRNEYRAGLDVATSGAGKETIPAGFVNQLERALLEFGGVRAVADVIRTDSGNDLPWPTMNDTTNKGAILAEATTIGATTDPAFSSLTLKAFKYSSKPILASAEILQDSAFDIGAMIGGWLGERIGRIQNDHFTTGAGTTLPKGLTVAGVVGKTAASMTTFTSDEVIDLLHSVDPAYRNGASFMFHDTVLAFIRKLKESTTNAYIWQPGLQAGVPDRLLGYPYTVNQSMATAFTTGQKLVLFGQMSKYKIRDVSTIRLVRMDERYADTDQIAFIAFMRTDGNLLDAGTRPVKWLALA